DLRYTESAADFNQLAAGNDDLFAFCHGAQDQHDGSGVVVDDHSILSAGQLGDEAFHMGVAAAAAALFQIVFEGVVVLRNALDRADSSIAEFGTTEVGVQHDAGGIDDRAQAHGCFFGDTADDLIADAVDLHR